MKRFTIKIFAMIFKKLCLHLGRFKGWSLLKGKPILLKCIFYEAIAKSKWAMFSVKLILFLNGKKIEISDWKYFHLMSIVWAYQVHYRYGWCHVKGSADRVKFINFKCWKLNKTIHHHIAYLLSYMNPYLDFLIQAHFVYKLGLKRHYYQFFY